MRAAEIISAGAALLLSGVFVGGARAATNITSPIVTTNYYIFGGTNAAQLHAAMVAARPWKQTMSFDAHTKWDINSSFRYSRTNGEYRLAGIEVKTRVAITLPRWIPGKPVPRDLVSRWQKLFTGLSVHEQGHLQLAAAAAAEVSRRLQELGGYPSARELTAAANRALNETIEEYRERERKYDAVTRHGRTQGAIFPIEAEPEELIIAPAATPGGSLRRQGTRGR